MERPRPLLITAKNCSDVLGLNWRFVRKKALQLGVPILDLGSRRLAIEAGPLIDAIRAASNHAPLEEMDDASQRAAMRLSLGLKVVGHG